MSGYTRAIEWRIPGKSPRGSSGANGGSMSQTKPRHYQMKRFIAGLMYHVLTELLSQLLIRLGEWAGAVPWF